MSEQLRPSTKPKENEMPKRRSHLKRIVGIAGLIVAAWLAFCEFAQIRFFLDRPLLELARQSFVDSWLEPAEIRENKPSAESTKPSPLSVEAAVPVESQAVDETPSTSTPVEESSGSTNKLTHEVILERIITTLGLQVHSDLVVQSNASEDVVALDLQNRHVQNIPPAGLYTDRTIHPASHDAEFAASGKKLDPATLAQLEGLAKDIATRNAQKTSLKTPTVVDKNVVVASRMEAAVPESFPASVEPALNSVPASGRQISNGSETPALFAFENGKPQTNPVALANNAELAQPNAGVIPSKPGEAPFEVIDEVGEIKVTVRRSKLLRLQMDIYRTAVVDPGICDIVQFSPREMSIIGRGIGSTHLTMWFEGQARPQTYVVTVESDEAVRTEVEREYQKLEDIVAELFPDSKVRLTVMADKLIVRGQAKDSEEAAQILSIIRNQGNGVGGIAGIGGIGAGAAARVLSDWETGQTGNNRPQLQLVNMLQVPGVQQVSLRVKIAEVNRTAARGFGVDLGGHINFTNNPKGSQLFLQSLLGLTTGTGGGQSLLAQFDGDDIAIGIRYLQQHGVIRLLSEPTLVTMSGTAATFVAGGEFAVPTVVGSAGLNAVTTDFRAFGAIVSFLPTVIDKDRIRLQVSPEFSQVNAALTVGGTPGLNTRSVNTTVEMREGQTLALAGLLEDNMKQSQRGNMPFLYPWIGQRDSSRNETELLILVTPELVHPMDPEEVPPLPGFDMTEPDNWEFFIGAKLEGNPTRDYRSTVWPRLRQRYNAGGTSMISGPFGHGQ